MRSVVGSLSYFLMVGALAYGQDAGVTVIPARADRYDSQLGRTPRPPATVNLIPQSSDGRVGRIWITSSSDGLLVEGEVEGAEPDWPANPGEMLAKDHVEVWLAASPKVTLPPIGWGNQFGEQDLASEAGCDQVSDQKIDTAACRAWFQEQVRYREQFRRLFVRQWLVSGDRAPNSYSGHVVEAFAHPAMLEITSKFFPDVYAQDAIAPAWNDHVSMSVTPGVPAPAAYTFRVEIPYSAFPPVPSLDVSDVWLMVDVFSPPAAGKKIGAFSTTAAHRKWGDPATFNHLRIEQPLRIQVSPCAYPLVQKDVYGKPQPTFVYPVPNGTAPGGRVMLDKVTVVLNPAEGYLYAPGGASPKAEVRQLFSQRTSDGGYACGPQLAYAKGAVAARTDQLIHKEGFDTKVLPDGWTLVKTGPRADYSTFGSGQCGACPRAELEVYAISPKGDVEPALKTYELVGNDTVAADFDFAADWSKAVYYHQQAIPATGEGGAWTADTYCLQGHAYKPCGTKPNATPPNPPRVKELRGGDH